MHLIYVAGPYSASNVIDVLKNIGRGQKVCAELFAAGYAPFCPWHDRTFITDNPDHEFSVEQFYEYSIEFLKRADAMFLVPSWEESDGTKKEINIANKIGIPVFDNMQDLIRWNSLK